MIEFKYPVKIDAADEMEQWLQNHTGSDNEWDTYYDKDGSMDIIIAIKDEQIAALFLLKFGGIVFKK